MPPTATSSLKRLKAPIADATTLTTREKLIVLNGSKLHGCKFRPWDKDPAADEFDRPPFQDDTVFHFSEEQLEVLSGWRRAAEPESASTALDQGQPLDLVQDIATDCSVVASLCAETARVERLGSREHSIAASVIFPTGHSQNGKYVCKLNFNGCFRRVEIDDRLPISRTGQALHVVDRGRSGVVWPALVEKAYLKVTGGYDFPGSNPGMDLWVLTGWIPEQTFLQSEEIVPSSFWRRLYNAFNYGDVLVTLGTGALTREEESLYGLARKHAYAVIDMKEDGQQRMLHIKNPWSEGGVWTGDTSSANDPQIEIPKHAKEAIKPGTFWMDLSHVFQHFETIYFNWNPGLFTYRRDAHFAWDLSQRSAWGSFASNPQYLLRSETGGTAWLLLSKHYQDFSREDIKEGLPDPRLQEGALSLYVFERQKRVELTQGFLSRAPYVSGPNVLLRLEMQAHTSYIIVPSEQDMLHSKLHFTLSAFTNGSWTELKVAEDKYPHVLKQNGAWTRDSAGGSSSCPRFHTNPQFKFVLPKACGVSIVLEAADPDVNVQTKLVWANGRRVPQSLTRKDIYGDSGDYRRGCAVVELPQVMAGSYTIVCSTFQPDQLGPFVLKVRTSHAGCSLGPISTHQPGRFTLVLPPATLPRNVDRILIPIHVSRLSRFQAQVRSMGSRAVPTPSPLKVALEFGQGPNKFVLASTGEFAEAARGSIGTAEVDLQPAMCAQGGPGLWLVVERMGGASTHPEEVRVEALSDGPVVSFGQWGQEFDETTKQLRDMLKIVQQP